MTFPRYPRYKDSGVGWLGEVPAHWEVKRLRYVALLNPSKSEIRPLPAETPVSFIPMEALGDDGSLVLDQTRALQDVIDGYTYVREGDVVVAKITPCFENGKAAIMRGLTNEVGLGTTELTVLRPRGPVTTSTYLFRVVTSEPFRWLGESHMYGAGGQKRVPDDFLRDFSIAWPPREEQGRIAAFLDHETGKIDGLIEEQRRLIELLKEKRQAVISHAVTKGLDPNVPMKDSGVEWLGEVPAHWEVGKIRYFARLESGHTPSRNHPEYWENCTVPWFTLADVWQIRSGEVTEVCDTSEKVSELGLAHSSARVLPKGTVMLSRTASVGFSAIMGRDMATTQDFANWVCEGKLDSRYLLFCFRAMKEEFSRLMRGSTHKTIYMPDIAELMCAVPPLHEQRKIVKAIEERLSATRSLIETATNAVSLLGERRSSLISAAVTGKIDVRGWSAGAEAEAPELAMVAEESSGYSAQGGAA